ncbi:AraC family transcriptional regulator [Kitasatospora sp. RG8]|uniref:AraC family transcriptional regulator n=1 Tax=Kitasatospora sp. RG8 TaxID=2820815 RepID=UPI001AE05093|nr:AraC family transcriptional regulator [Kitasatospora sp. RG8]MBP0451266.1 AraC family transcriptional regulator [Kitasatospora sp. RG8]
MNGPDLGRGVLHPGRAAGVVHLDRYGPAPGLARLVEFYWLVRWDRRGLPAHEQKVLAHPNVHLVFEAPRARVYGVDRSLFVRRLEGAGHVLGVKFRPGGFRPFTDRPVAGLADRSVPAAGVFGAAVDLLNEEVLSGAAEPAALVDAFLLARLPAPVADRQAELAAAMVERVTGSPDLRRVDELAAEFGVTVRQVQRLFAEYVGAAPKWVLRRARLHEAAQRADRGADVDWAALAAELGYADQAHFTRDFTAAVGLSPARYAGGR